MPAKRNRAARLERRPGTRYPDRSREKVLAKRKAISTRTRFEVFKRDGFVCQYCGDHPPKVILHVDHIVAVANGGDNLMDNLVTSCAGCNMGKSAVPLTDIPRSLTDKAAEVAEREAQLRGYHDVLQARRDRLEAECWEIATVLRKTAEEGFPRDWLRSIKTFLERLPFHEVLDAMEIAASRPYFNESKAFRYFCGICWRKIKEDGQG